MNDAANEAKLLAHKRAVDAKRKAEAVERLRQRMEQARHEAVIARIHHVARASGAR